MWSTSWTCIDRMLPQPLPAQAGVSLRGEVGMTYKGITGCRFFFFSSRWRAHGADLEGLRALHSPVHRPARPGPGPRSEGQRNKTTHCRSRDAPLSQATTAPRCVLFVGRGTQEKARVYRRPKSASNPFRFMLREPRPGAAPRLRSRAWRRDCLPGGTRDTTCRSLAV